MMQSRLGYYEFNKSKEENEGDKKLLHHFILLDDDPHEDHQD